MTSGQIAEVIFFLYFLRKGGDVGLGRLYQLSSLIWPLYDRNPRLIEIFSKKSKYKENYLQ